MLSKSFIGGLLITLALLLLAGLRWLTATRTDTGSGDAKKFQMPHEFPNKSLIEKEVTEGMDGIPETNNPVTDGFESDSYFTNTESDSKSPPTDLF